MDFLVAVAACLIAILLLKWVVGDGKKRPPGPWNLPVIGYIPFLSRLPHLDFQRLAKKYGNIFSLRLGSHYVIVINDFESTKEANAQDALMGRPPDSAFDLSKETIETDAINGLPWKEQRKFSLHMLRDLGLGKTKMETHIQEEINELLEHFEEITGKPIILRSLLTSSMSNNIGSLVFGKRLKYGDPVRKMLTDLINESAIAAGQVTWQIFFPWLKKLLESLGLGHVDRIAILNEKFKEYVRREVDEHEATLDPNDIRDFIDGYLLEIKKRPNEPSFTKSVLVDLVGAFFGAGSETVQLTVEWLMLTAAAHQDSQRRIQKEIDEVIGRDRFPMAPDQKSMPYTEAFVAEVMRWRIIIPINITRYTLGNTEVGGYFIDKHSQVLSNLWAIHHDPEYWGTDAEEFRPERFLTEDGKAFKKRDHFIPFSIGKRQCPGEQLAKVEIFLYFASLLQRFSVRLPDGKKADFEGKLGIGLVPKPQEMILTIRT